MSFIEEPDTPALELDEFDPVSEYLLMEEIAQNLFFAIKEYLYRQGERDLLKYLMWTDIAKMLFPDFENVLAQVPYEMR